MTDASQSGPAILADGVTNASASAREISTRLSVNSRSMAIEVRPLASLHMPAWRDSARGATMAAMADWIASGLRAGQTPGFSRRRR